MAETESTGTSSFKENNGLKPDGLYMEITNRKGLPSNIKSELCQHVNDAVVATIQEVIEPFAYLLNGGAAKRADVLASGVRSLIISLASWLG